MGRSLIILRRTPTQQVAGVIGLDAEKRTSSLCVPLLESATHGRRRRAAANFLAVVGYDANVADRVGDISRRASFPILVVVVVLTEGGTRTDRIGAEFSRAHGTGSTVSKSWWTPELPGDQGFSCGISFLVVCVVLARRRILAACKGAERSDTGEGRSDDLTSY